MPIKRLGDEVGNPLFERIGKTVRLTPDGTPLIGCARHILKEHEDAVMELSKPALKGVTRFGSPEHDTAGVVPELLARLASVYPEVMVEMRCGTSDAIRRAVQKGDLDIGLGTQA